MPPNAAEPCCIAVAYSAGRDSTALLHATASAARAYPGMVVLALHVHHGLSLQADDWLRHAERCCAQWQEQGLPVRLVSRHLKLAPQRGQSIEAEARSARYRALGDMAREAGADVVLLAHHQRDQAETLLLQALRGAGLNGLAAMPPEAERDGVRWMRPWLNHPREAIEAYVAQHGLRFIDDDSNEHVRFARNHLRLEVWPSLVAAFPHAEASLAASARRLQDVLPGAQAWRDELVQALRTPEQEGVAPGLNACAWAECSGAQRREALRHWYRALAGASLPASWVERLAHEIPGLVFHQRPARWPEIGLTLYRGELHYVKQGTGWDEGARLEGAPRVTDADITRGHLADLPTASSHVRLSIQTPGLYPLPAWSGALRVLEAQSGGVQPSLLAAAVARSRAGGEQFQSGLNRPARSLKKQFQSHSVPPWCRGGPLIWSGEALIFVPGLGVDARAMAPVGALQWRLEWVPGIR